MPISVCVMFEGRLQKQAPSYTIICINGWVYSQAYCERKWHFVQVSTKSKCLNEQLNQFKKKKFINFIGLHEDASGKDDATGLFNKRRHVM